MKRKREPTKERGFECRYCGEFMGISENGVRNHIMSECVGIKTPVVVVNSDNDSELENLEPKAKERKKKTLYRYRKVRLSLIANRLAGATKIRRLFDNLPSKNKKMSDCSKRKRDSNSHYNKTRRKRKCIDKNDKFMKNLGVT